MEAVNSFSSTLSLSLWWQIALGGSSLLLHPSLFFSFFLVKIHSLLLCVSPSSLWMNSSSLCLSSRLKTSRTRVWSTYYWRIAALIKKKTKKVSQSVVLSWYKQVFSLLFIYFFHTFFSPSLPLSLSHLTAVLHTKMLHYSLYFCH